MSNGYPMDIHWTGGTIPSGQRILMAKLDMSERRRKDEIYMYTPHLLSLWYLQTKVLISRKEIGTTDRQAGRQVDVFHLTVIHKEFLEFLASCSPTRSTTTA